MKIWKEYEDWEKTKVNQDVLKMTFDTKNIISDVKGGKMTVEDAISKVINMITTLSEKQLKLIERLVKIKKEEYIEYTALELATKQSQYEIDLYMKEAKEIEEEE